MPSLADYAFITTITGRRIVDVEVHDLTLDEAAAACFAALDDLDPEGGPYNIEIVQKGD